MRPDGIWERYMNKEQEGGKAAGLESEDDRYRAHIPRRHVCIVYHPDPAMASTLPE